MIYQDKPPLDELMHYGMPRRSGRYPWGSGENPYQHSGDFLARVEELKKSGKSEPEIAKELGILNEKGQPSTTRLRTQISLAKDERRQLKVDTAKSLREKGYSNTEIGKKMGINESSVRSLLNENSEIRTNQAMKTAEFLKQQIKEKGMIDVGTGVERELGISKEKLNQALYILEMEGYPTYGGGVPQVTNKGKQTNLKVLCPPGTEHKEIYNYDQIHSIVDYTTHDDGQTFEKFQYPKSISGDRVFIRYSEEGGNDRDGLVELRRNVPDLSLGESRYSQVRILVDDKKYIKGMALYSDEIPDGYDIVFNTNKKKGTPKEDVLKTIKDDPDNPFGSLIKANGQSYYTDPKTGKRELSAINKRADESDWSEWADKLPSQFLGKQNISLVKQQLGLAAADKQNEYDEIMSLTNPTVKKVLLKSFADDCDSAAVHLKAAALPRQKYHVIIPVNTMKDNEVYAPNYETGEKLALIRYPHGGTFEIPILTVNNNQPQAKKMLGNATDAVGINKKVADRLSGADFDGDTVMTIPCNSPRSKVKITSTPPLKGLEGFDTKLAYGTIKKDDGYYNASGQKIKVMKNTQTEMGKVSNLITDMTLKGATQDELARAVRHSMVVIDAEKHKLDYKQSEKDNGIAALKKKYQGRVDEDGKYHEGASTLLSRAKSQVSVPRRQGMPKIDPETGEYIWKTKEDRFYVKDGKTVERMQKSTAMYETKDARTLSSGHPTEEVYADYANRMKALGNEARKAYLNAGKIPYSATASMVYQKEVDSLDAKLLVSLKNAPRERQAQTMANAVIKAKKQANPDMKPDELKKESQRALSQARATVGAKREPVVISDSEWTAIQAGAISPSKLEKILNHADMDRVKELATPRTTTTITPAKAARIKALSASGNYTTAQIAAVIGCSPSTVSKYMKGKE